MNVIIYTYFTYIQFISLIAMLCFIKNELNMEELKVFIVIKRITNKVAQTTSEYLHFNKYSLEN